MLERIFDLSALAPLRDRLVELDPAWVESAARTDKAFTQLGDRLARHLIDAGQDFVLTSVRVGIADGGHAAASMHAAAYARACSPDDLRVHPLRGLALERLATTLRAPAAPQLQGWLRLGAWVCGEPACNPEPHGAEIPLLLALSRLRSRRARRFLAAAA